MKQCCLCGKSGHESSECKWSSADLCYRCMKPWPVGDGQMVSHKRLSNKVEACKHCGCWWRVGK